MIDVLLYSFGKFESNCHLRIIDIYLVVTGQAISTINIPQFSQSPDMKDTMTVSATTTTYTADDLCGPRANVTDPLMFQDPGFFHTALLKASFIYFLSFPPL